MTTLPHADLPIGDSPAGALAVFLAASVGVHLLLALLLPGFRAAEVTVREPLEVTIERRELARPVPPASVAAMPAPVARSEPTRKRMSAPAAASPGASPVAEAPPVLALREPKAAPEPIASGAAPEPSPGAAAADPAAPGGAARAGSAADGPPGPSGGPAKGKPSVSTASYRHKTEVPYPLSARRRGEEGTVVLKVLVRTDGSAGSITVQHSSGFTSLDRAAVESVKSWRFEPAREGTQPIETWHLVPIVFNLRAPS